MYTSQQCIVLRTTRYADRKAIVTVWSRSHGRLSLMVPDGDGRGARRRRAIMMPLALVEGECDIRPGKEIHSMRDAHPLKVLPDIAADPIKSVVALFLSEVLDRILREAQPDERLTDYIFGAVEWLDGTAAACATANFPLVFLYNLGCLLGIEPDSSTWRPDAVFDMQGGVFRQSPPAIGRWLDSHEAQGVWTLRRMTFASSARLHLPRETRRRMLDTILEYISIHLTPLANLKSLPVLRDMF